MSDLDLIHALTFEMAFDAKPAESAELADWIQADMLPVIEQVLDLYRGKRSRRIERLEIDLGTVPAAQARSELPRRLFVQLSSALEDTPAQAGTAASTRDTPGPAADMLAFLRHGTMPWARDAHAAHTQLLRQVIDTRQAHEVLSVALREAPMLTRLIRQFDSQELFAAAGALCHAWTETERAATLAWAEDELRRRRQAGSETESFWRWFLPQCTQAASPDMLRTRWERACRGEPEAEPYTTPQAAAVPSPQSIAGFGADAMSVIEQGLENADAVLLAPYWDRILASAPQCIRNAHPRLWQRWLNAFDADTLVDILGVMQADFAWLIECLATVVPRARLNALLRPAMPRWFAEPADSLAPDAVLAWVKDAVPEHAARILALFATPDSEDGPDTDNVAPVADSIAIRQPDASMPSIAFDQIMHWPPAQRDAVLARAGKASAPTVGSAGFTPAEMHSIEQGLETADFALLAPYWDRVLSSAPQLLRTIHPRRWEHWLRNFDDEVLTDILGVLQADCAGLIERLATVVPRPRLNAVLHPALPHWLAAPAGSLAPQAVLALITQSLPEQSDRILAFLAAEKVEQDLHSREKVVDASADRYRRSDAKEPFMQGGPAPADSHSLASALAPLPDAGLPGLLADLDEAGRGLRSSPSSRSHEQLRKELAKPQVLAQLVPRLDVQQRLMTARVLFNKWPEPQRCAVLTWAVDKHDRLREAGADETSFWVWLLSRHAEPATLDAVVRSYTTTVERETHAAPSPAGALTASPAMLAAGKAQEPAADRAAGGKQGAVDSKHFREPLRVLGPIFARAEIITISKCLNAGEFQLLAPYWDRLLVLAPHWLRSEYPRLARTWLAGFSDEVRIDILSVVQAECCALIERLASVLPREQFHAALRPSLARWFDLGLDQLTPQAIMEDVLRTTPGQSAGLQALLGAQVPSAVAGGTKDTAPMSLEELLERGDAEQWRRNWPSIVIAQRAQLRRHWQQLSKEKRYQAIAGITTRLNLAQQLDLAVMLQPGLAPLMAELLRVLGERSERHDVLHTALQLLLHAEVASIVPERLMQYLLEKHRSLRADLPSDPTRHIAAALHAIGPAPGPRPPEGQAAALASATLSEAALRAYLGDRQAQEARFSTLNSAQLHGLVQAWAGFQQAGEGTNAFLSAVEERALCAATPHAFFGKVLQQAMLGEPIDLDQIGADCGAGVTASFVQPIPSEELAVRHVERDPSAAPAHREASPLSPMLCQALPQRLADAMLRADLSTLDALWADLVRYHPDLLRQAAQRYLGRAEARRHLIDRTDSGKMHELLGCLSGWTARLAAPLLDLAARFGIMLPIPLAPDAFAQHVLRFAFTQVMERPTSTEPAEWVSDLLRSLLPASPQRSDVVFTPVAHAWYELLRGEDTPLKAAFERALFGNVYLDVARQRLRGGAGDSIDAALPEALQQMLTMELCDSHPALTDQLLTDDDFIDANAAVFSAGEWQALARAQLPRQEPKQQLAFWRAVAAQLPAPASDRSADEEEVQAAFRAAFGVLGKPARQAADASSLVFSPDQAPCLPASAETIAILLMRERAPDQAVKASITLLMQRLLADANADTDAHVALHSALSHHRVLDRLLDIVPGPTLARLLCTLRPRLACALPAVLRALSDILPTTLPPVPAMLDGAIWRAVFDTIFIGAAPASAGDMFSALVARLAGDHAQEGPAWQQKIDALRLAPAPGAAQATPAEAMAQLLRPLTGPQAQQAAARTTPVDQAPAPFTGDANLRNAGLVIIAPYIERLFALLDITKDGVFVSEETRQRGVHILQFAITAEETTPEYLLVLNKLLCGIPAAVPVVPGISMTEKEKSTIEQMLKGVIAHWSAIGASSIEGLRETFLQREGCLYYEEEAWHLKIPQRTFDMLLDRLPWSYKMIKFSWMTAPLNVTWR
ncbi:contractile injection system tape measure protein [Duganella radicis]|uniref:Uncharacterized protein n=1 Tax=Duganella radicis TaxID=551988 RepID=A0A6L6PBV2_9BURK|nr:contractile injection system tape measure protein [Duganella radicis]MTV36313.1 hypothetical protein [Duganella radicis]